MAVISISIIESQESVMAGIPRTITLETNIPSTIFYTLDGSTPTIASSVYIDILTLPTNQSLLIVKFFATNGIDSSSIITKTYSTNISGDRLARFTTENLNNIGQNLFPFGSPSSGVNDSIISNNQAGINVSTVNGATYSQGFDADGYASGYTDKAIETYTLVYNNTDVRGRPDIGPGTFPSKTTVIGKQGPTIDGPEETNYNIRRTFNPRAKVIFQNVSEETTEDPIHINRPYFTLENSEVVKDGRLLTNDGSDTLSFTGSFIRAVYNPRTQENTYYYRDAGTNRWIISTCPYNPTDPNPGELYHMVQGRSGSFVFQWHLFMSRKLI